MGWFFKEKEEEKEVTQDDKSYLARPIDMTLHKLKNESMYGALGNILHDCQQATPKVKQANIGAEDGFDEVQIKFARHQPTVSNAIIDWYANQSGFIGHQLCSIIGQNYLVDKACAMPGRDATRQGFDIVTPHDDGLSPEALNIFKKYDKKYELNKHLVQFVRFGRMHGISIYKFVIESDDPDFYMKPFNIDGIKKGSYKGMARVEPYYASPVLDADASSRPGTLHFFEPTWWIIDGKKYHRSHLVIFRNDPPSDLLKPLYIYGGIPLTQRIYERVYAAEKTANEAPLLALTKRIMIWLTDMSAFASAGDSAAEKMEQFSEFMNNYGIKIGDKTNDDFKQFDVSLSDLDAVIMGQYQLVASIANVPATKLLGTSPKGFNTTGEYEQRAYHESLESIQTHDLTPLVERHHSLVMKSFIMPELKMKEFIETEVSWRPLDSPTALEYADIELRKAQTGAIYIEAGVFDADVERERLATAKNGDYTAVLSNLGADEEE